MKAYSENETLLLSPGIREVLERKTCSWKKTKKVGNFTPDTTIPNSFVERSSSETSDCPYSISSARVGSNDYGTALAEDGSRGSVPCVSD